MSQMGIWAQEHSRAPWGRACYNWVTEATLKNVPAGFALRFQPGNHIVRHSHSPRHFASFVLPEWDVSRAVSMFELLLFSDQRQCLTWNRRNCIGFDSERNFSRFSAPDADWQDNAANWRWKSEPDGSSPDKKELVKLEANDFLKRLPYRIRTCNCAAQYALPQRADWPLGLGSSTQNGRERASTERTRASRRAVVNWVAEWWGAAGDQSTGAGRLSSAITGAAGGRFGTATAPTTAPTPIGGLYRSAPQPVRDLYGGVCHASIPPPWLPRFVGRVQKRH